MSSKVRTYYIQEGNTVRHVEELTPEVRIRREEERRREIERKRRMQARKHARAMRKNRLYTMYLASAVIVLVGLLVGYVNLQTSITTRMDNISGLESQITQIKADNSATANRISTQTNLNDIKTAAINELGMNYVNPDQIVYYHVDRTDYMSQYNDIP